MNKNSNTRFFVLIREAVCDVLELLIPITYFVCTLFDTDIASLVLDFTLVLLRTKFSLLQGLSWDVRTCRVPKKYFFQFENEFITIMRRISQSY